MGSHGSKLVEYNNERGINFLRQESSGSDLGALRPAEEEVDRDNIVNTTFTWSLGGHAVYLTGSFTKWKSHYPLIRQGSDFTVTVALAKGVYQYKFIVDGEWRFNPDEPTISDQQGNVNNVIDTTHYKQIERAYQLEQSSERKASYNDKYEESASVLPAFSHYCRHLNSKEGRRHSDDQRLTANAVCEMLQPRSSLDEPLHVVLNHLALREDKYEGVRMMALTQRFKQKFSTIVYYTPQVS